jgi:hypothetical protein
MPKYLLIVIVPNGLIVRNTPRPESQGGVKLRTEAVGAQLYAQSIHNIGGVEYALLVPRNPNQPEWIRVAEAGGTPKYVDIISLEQEGTDTVSQALNNIAQAIRELKNG